MSCIRNCVLVGRPIKDREPRQSLRYGRESLFRAHVALMRQAPEIDPSPLDRRGRIPDEKIPGHGVTNKSSVSHLHPQKGRRRSANELMREKAKCMATPPQLKYDIKTDLTVLGYPVYAVYRIHRRDGTATGQVLGVLRKTDEAKLISQKTLKSVRPFQHTHGGPAQESRSSCQRYGHAKIKKYLRLPATGMSLHPRPAFTHRGESSPPRAEPEPSRDVSRRSPPEPAPTRPIIDILELKQCIKKYGIDIVLVQETFLKPIRIKSCALAGYVQLHTDRTNALPDGTTIYYKHSLHCCPINLPNLTNIEATGCKLAMTGHATDEIDTSIGALTNHIKKVVKKCSQEVPVAVDRRRLPADALDLLKAKNAALQHAYAYPSRRNRSSTRALQRRIRARMMETRLSKHLFGKDLIINEQFCPKHPCPQQALCLIEYITKGFKTKKRTVAVFFGVAKAFDRVWQTGLIYKLYLLEVPDRLIHIINHYLTDRHLIFKHENTHSSRRLITAGVPQGSTLSPLLYSAYINDILRPLAGVQLALFTDDTALYLRGQTERSIYLHLQRAIDKLARWFQT
ncbi:Probable RNA-directed DNA polymerase from transposon BS [Eumeta japonica]|uniref:Probable RNA-directed DNA polymerase from transposon BS n=1 Tax=Eumeta variegata TaxID=151549 RepID=A0A4C1WYE9_EUMVA|nr:Probable RNA-directed DNA polymerase from transposon BS [Eumeta japonica]